MDDGGQEVGRVVTIRLLGPPAIERDGVAVRPPRGRKAWAVLCYVLLASRPVSRKHLAELLFADADDPLGAVRWTLAELRRSLGTPGAFAGDPVAPALGEDVAVDVDVLGAEIDPAALLEVDGELIDGVNLDSCPEFESWLVVERHRVAARIEARLRRAAVGLVAAGRPADAIAFASRTVAMNPLDEGNHELLVRSLAMAGQGDAAQRQIAVCEDLLRRELGIEASAALRDAVNVGVGSAMVLPLSGRAAAVSQLEAGRAAIAAGAVDAGVQCLRQAVAEAARGGDVALQGQALAALGMALVHAVRGRDEEGAVVLNEAAQRATTAGDQATAVTAYRELGYVEVQAGRRDTADAFLAAAAGLAETDGEHASVLAIRGMNSSDRADYPAALAQLTESVDRARRGTDPRQEAWSLAVLGRAHVLRGERSQATAALDRSLQLVQGQRWLAFQPFPQSLRAELDLEVGDLDAATDGLERAWVLACQLNDPCWEGMAARGLGLLHSGRGDRPAATRWLTEAANRCSRVSDRYQWVHVHVLDSLITAALDHDDVDQARPLVGTMAALAARCDLGELVVRAHLHRARIGEPGALSAARRLAADIDNPELRRMVGVAGQ
jgi:DNA-binding SARP family transcriptional activator